MIIDGYDCGDWFDEIFDASGKPRPEAQLLLDIIHSQPEGEFERLQETANAALVNLGITFNVYSDGAGVERVLPFDILPRVIRDDEWDHIERGLKQRIYALNLFLQDVYNEARILRDGVVPEELVLSAPSYREACRGLTPPQGIWCHITGTDLVRDRDGRFYVLEDNLRCPSGVSYVLENRRLMKQTFPGLFASSLVRSVDDYPSKLLDLLTYISPRPDHLRAAVLTPGVYNSAYFEHSYLAQQMGIELVEGRDLVVIDDAVHMRTTRGLERVDVLYRRVDDDFLDPQVFRQDSMLGVPGLMRAYKSGHLGLVNAPGTGVADDKVVYAFVPQIIRYYLGEEPILDNVPTYLCWRDSDMSYVLEHMAELVVKPANESGGYGLLVGPQATTEELDDFKQRVKASPRNYIAQPTLALSRAPVIVGDHLEGRHVDLRPYILYGRDLYVLPGGLTRVALKKGSLVVNSSQGGGSKDTWVVSARDQAC
ncbi:MAG TPA: circularly permuted type 2 ATP-grasp protein [Dehalococcoidia bacterium]|nr:circularly permuted type 2 ATP-grasp protein [Dehalococcoidia bacterium]